ncbi:MAG TPA: hypothetical protein VHU89_09200 [Acidobacteriaceae bacterium]|nr:hypothetical protein [Acidobacteriaceae bacterium]
MSLLTSIVLAVTVALFAWFTWARWGTLGIFPVVGRVVIAAAVFALAFAGLLTYSGRRAARRRRPASAASEPSAVASQPPVEACQATQEKAKVTTVELL